MGGSDWDQFIDYIGATEGSVKYKVVLLTALNTLVPLLDKLVDNRVILAANLRPTNVLANEHGEHVVVELEHRRGNQHKHDKNGVLKISFHPNKEGEVLLSIFPLGYLPKQSKFVTYQSTIHMDSDEKSIRGKFKYAFNGFLK